MMNVVEIIPATGFLSELCEGKIIEIYEDTVCL
jgi:hypothetical protein